MNPLQPSSQELLGSREFRRLLWGSLVCHLALVTAFWLGGQLRWPSPLQSAPVFVDIIAPAPAPAPPAAAKPKPARETPVVIPKRARPKPKPKPKPVVKAEVKPEPKPEPKVEPKPEAAPSASELLAKIRDRVDTSAQSEPGRTAGPGGVFNPQLAAYGRDIKVLLNSSWVGAAQFRTQPGLESTYEVKIDDGGQLRNVQLTASSGNRFYDESTERAIYRAAPFPPPPDGGRTLEVHFRPSGVF